MFSAFERWKDREGIGLLKAGKLDEALVYFAGRLRKVPKDARIHIQIAKIYFRKKNYPETKDWLAKAVTLPIGEPEIRDILSMTNFRKISSQDYYNAEPSFSPDGQWLAFTSARADTNSDGRIGPEDRRGLYAAHLPSGTETQISTDDFHNSHPSFSWDGRKMAYLSARADSNGDGRIDPRDDAALYVVDMETGEETCLMEASFRPKFPTFSPDGNFLAFCAWYPPSRVGGVYIIELSSRKIRPIQTQFECNFPVFSPKGNRLIYPSWRRDTNGDGSVDLSDNSGIYSFDLKTGHESEIVPDRFSNSYPCFDPGGNSIVYLSRRRDTNGDGVINSLDNSGIYILDLKSSKERTIRNDEHYNKFPVFSPDGKQILFIGSWQGRARKEDDDIENSAYFETKGIHIIDSDGKNERELLSTKHYGSKFLAVSPRDCQAAYLSWRQDTNRGLYLAPYDRLPSLSEIRQLIENNLQ